MNFEKAEGLTPYNPGTGECATRLDANESCFSLPERLREKIARAVREAAFNRYPDPLARDVCKALAAVYGVDPALVTAGNGSDELISIIFNTFVSKGQKVLMTKPDFSMYRFYCALAECEPVMLEKNDGLAFNAETLLAAAARERPAMIIFSNPCNPTGQGISRKEALRLVKSSDCLVVIDEAYMDFWSESLLGEYQPENLIVLRTCSKMGLAAIRLGFAVAPARLTGFLRAAKPPYNVNALTQAAGLAVLGEPSWLKETAAKTVALKNSLERSLKELERQYPASIRVYGTHTNFSVVRSAHAARIDAKLREKGVSVRFLPPALLRITSGSEVENRAFLTALAQILEGGVQ